MQTRPAKQTPATAAAEEYTSTDDKPLVYLSTSDHSHTAGTKRQLKST